MLLQKRSIARLLRHFPTFATLAPALPTLNSFASVRVCRQDMPALLSMHETTQGEVLFRFTGHLIPINTGDRCLQVGAQRWMTPDPEQDEPPWVYLNHSFDPSVHISHTPLPETEDTSAAAEPLVLTATANHNLPIDAPLTIDYTLHEHIMFDDGFVCAESLREVRGFHYLTQEEQAHSLPRAMEHIQRLHTGK